MRQQIIPTVLFISMAIGFLMACSKYMTASQVLATRIIASRVSNHGIQKWPVLFTPLVAASQLACAVTEDKDQAIQSAFTSIATVIFRDLNDPLLKEDLTLFIESLGIVLDPDLIIITLPPGSKKLLEILICTFAQPRMHGGEP